MGWLPHGLLFDREASLLAVLLRYVYMECHKRRMEPKLTKIDAGWLGAALRASRHLTQLFVAFCVLAMLSMSAFTLVNLVLGEAFLRSANFQRVLNLLSFPVFAAGIGSVLGVGFAWWGFWHCRIVGQGISLHEISHILKSRLCGPAKHGPVTLASAIAGALIVGVVVAGIGAVVGWNELRRPGLEAVTSATIAVFVLALGFVHLLPKLTNLFFGRQKVEQDSDFILLLRSFKRDALHTRSRGLLQPFTLEGTVVNLLERYARVIAVADPRHDVQPVGAERIPLAMAEWQQRVLVLMDKAAAIVIAIDESPGIVWELERVTEGGRLEKAIFVVWTGQNAWPEGPWAQWARRLGIDTAAGSVAEAGGDVALGAICLEDRVMIATAKASTPHSNSLATMMLLHHILQARDTRQGLLAVRPSQSRPPHDATNVPG